MNMEMDIVIDKITILEGRGWFIDINFSILYCMNLLTGEIEKEYRIPIFSDKKYQYRRMVEYGKCLVLVPYNSAFILIFDTEGEVFYEIEVEDTYSDNSMQMLFTDGLIYDNEILLIPARYKAIVVLDMATKNLFYYPEAMREVCNQSVKRNRHLLSGDYGRKDDNIFFPMWQTNSILVFSMLTKESMIVCIEDKKEGLYAICINDTEIIVSSREMNNVYRLDLTGALVEQVSIELESKGKRNRITGILSHKNGYILLCSEDRNMYLWNSNRNKASVMKKCLDYENKTPLEYRYGDSNFISYTTYNNELYLYSHFECVVYVVSLDTGEVSSIDMKHRHGNFNIEQKMEVMKYVGAFLAEDDWININSFLDFIQHDSKGE